MSKPPGKRAVRALVRKLLAERGVAAAAVFGTQVEGRRLPGPHEVESLSGYALARDGSVYAFWLDWDAEQDGYTLRPFRKLDDLGVLADDPEYLAARRRARLGGSGS